MIRADMIPDEVVEAALPFSALCAYYCNPSANDCQCRQNLFRALAAALSAWPEANVIPGMQRGMRETKPIIVLPLPQDKTND